MSEHTRLTVLQNIPMSTPMAVDSAPLRPRRRSSSSAGAAAEDGGSNACNMNPSRDANRGAPPSAVGVDGAEEAPGRTDTRHSVVAAALAAPGAGSGKRKSKPGSSKPSKQPKHRGRVWRRLSQAPSARLPKRAGIRGVAGMPEAVEPERPVDSRCRALANADADGSV